MPKPRRRKLEIQVGDLVIVEWRDAVADLEWMARDRVEELKPIIRSIGWVQKASQDSIIIAGDIGSGDSESNRRMEVPLGMVQQVMLLHRQKKSKTSK